MITAVYAKTMALYNGETNRRIYGAAGRLSEVERRRDRGAFWHIGSLRGGTVDSDGASDLMAQLACSDC